MANQSHLDLASLNAVLQRVRRHPQDRALRLRAAEDVAVLAEYRAPWPKTGDKLLVDAAAAAKLLRRALERANKDEFASANDVAAFTAWIDRLHTLLLKAIERPS